MTFAAQPRIKITFFMMVLLFLPALATVARAAETDGATDEAAAAQEGAKPEKKEYKHPEHGGLGDIARKLADPTSDIWALFTEFELTFNNGNVAEDGPEYGGNLLFEPVLPIPLHGKGEKEWRLITRPVIPITLSTPVPTGAQDEFTSAAGLGDIVLPLVVSPPAGRWIIGVGPTFSFPSSTNDALGSQQVGVGPTVTFGYNAEALHGVHLAAVLLSRRGSKRLRSDSEVRTEPAQHALLLQHQPEGWMADRVRSDDHVQRE